MAPQRNFRIVQLTQKQTKGKMTAAGGKFWVSLLKNRMTLLVFCQIGNEGGRSLATNFLNFLKNLHVSNFIFEKKTHFESEIFLKISGEQFVLKVRFF